MWKEVNYKRLQKELQSPNFVLLHSTEEVMALKGRMGIIMNALTKEIRHFKNMSALDKKSRYCSHECRYSPCSVCRRIRMDRTRERIPFTVRDRCIERKIVYSIIDLLDDVLVDKSVRAYVNAPTKGGLY